MGLKGINPIEQHAEKVFAGVFVVSLLGVLAWQFVGKPNTVKIGKDDVPLPEAYSKIAEEARRTDARIKSGAPEGMPTDAGEAMKKLGEFDARLKGPVSPARELAGALGSGGLGIKGIAAPTGAAAGTYAQLIVPAPSRPIGASHMGLVDAWEVKQHPGVAKVLPPAMPFDKASVSIEMTFDGGSLKASLLNDPDGDGPIQSIPKNWWEGNLQVLAVLAERQTLNADGSWSDAQPVMLMPGRTSLVGELDKLTTAAAIKDAMRVATEQEKDVRRPDYYAIRLGEQWVPPTEREKVQMQEGEKAKKLAKFKSERDDLVRRRDALTKQLSGGGPGGAPGGAGPGGGGRDNPPPAPGGRGGGRTGGSPGGGGNNPTSGPNTGDDARKKSLQKQIDDAVKRLAVIDEELRSLGEGSMANAPQLDKNGKPIPEAPLLDNANVRLWLHDVSVERGKTYRYRSSVATNNPYFGHKAAMVAAQSAWADPGVLKGEWSEWSAPIQVAPETLVFITSAAEDNQIDRSASAKAEVFHFKWGFWRRGSATVVPGDAFAAQIDVPDYSKIITAAADAGPNDPPAAPGGTPGAAPGRRGTTAQAPGTAGGPAGGPKPDQTQSNAVPPPPMLKMEFGTESKLIFLGVGQGEAADKGDRARSALKVFVREADGAITVRFPDDEREDLEFRRATDSAEKGNRELTKPSDAQNRPNQGPDRVPGGRDRTPPPPDRAPPPGGG